MSNKPGPKEQQLRAMREAHLKRNQSIKDSKAKIKTVGRTTRLKMSRRGK